MENPKCRLCGERHRLGACPSFKVSGGDSVRPKRLKVVDAVGSLPAHQEGSDGGVEGHVASFWPHRGLTGDAAKMMLCVAEGEITRQAGIKRGPSEVKRGRPLAKDAGKTLAAQKPWEAEGVSRRTWYRRRDGK